MNKKIIILLTGLMILFLVGCSSEKVFIDKTFKEVSDTFKSSKLTTLQKDELWKNEYKGNYVKWTANVKRVDKTMGKYYIQVKHLNSTIMFDAQIFFPSSFKDQLLQLKEGQKITYIAQLDRSSGIITPYVLKDGEIIDVG